MEIEKFNEIDELLIEHEKTIRTLRSFFWCLVNQKEKVPGQVRTLLEILHPDMTQEQRYDVSLQIIAIVTKS